MMTSKSADDEIDHSMSSTPKNSEQQQQQQQQQQQIGTPLQYSRQGLEASFLSQSAFRSFAPMAAGTPYSYTPGGGAYGMFGGMTPLSAMRGLGGAASSMLGPSGCGASSYDASSTTLGSDERNAAASMSLLRGGGSLDHMLQSTPRRESQTTAERMTTHEKQPPMTSPGMTFHQYMTNASEMKRAADQLELEAARRGSGADPSSSMLRYGLSPAARSSLRSSLSQYEPAAVLKEFPFVFDGYSGWVCRHCSHLAHYYRGPNYSMRGAKPPSNDFVDKHLRFCPALNQPWSFGLGNMAAQGGQYGQIPMQHPREDEGKAGEGATPEEEKKKKFSRKRKKNAPDPPTGRSPTIRRPGPGDMTPQAATTAGIFPMYSQFPSQMTMSPGMSPNSKSPALYPPHNMMQQDSPPRKRRGGKNTYPKGHETTDKTYEKALAFLQKRADEMPRPSSSDDVGSTLVQEEDNTLLTDYFYYMMMQLTVCRFTEKDRKTRGGKRQNILVGYGGLQCIHCASTSSVRKFFWSNVDRLSNSFAEIPAHVLKCQTCPEEVTEALLVLKGRHTTQMELLPRGSQKVFLRRLWRRLHDGDSGAAETADTPAHRSASELESALKSPQVASGTAAEILKKNADVALTSPQKCDRVLLALPQDKDWLSDLDCFVRKQVEVFSASKTDVNDAKEDGKHRILQGQVGLCCLHCAKLGGGARGDAVTYPCAISGIYESVREFQRLHFDGCSNLPQELKSARSKLTSGASSLSSVLRRYYVQAAKALGLFDSTDGGIRAGGTVTPFLAAGFSGSVVAGRKRESSSLDNEGQDDEKKETSAKKTRYSDDDTPKRTSPPAA